MNEIFHHKGWTRDVSSSIGDSGDGKIILNKVSGFQATFKSFLWPLSCCLLDHFPCISRISLVASNRNLALINLSKVRILVIHRVKLCFEKIQTKAVWGFV